jgi:hypothetical protein
MINIMQHFELKTTFFRQIFGLKIITSMPVFFDLSYIKTITPDPETLKLQPPSQATIPLDHAARAVFFDFKLLQVLQKFSILVPFVCQI